MNEYVLTLYKHFLAVMKRDEEEKMEMSKLWNQNEKKKKNFRKYIMRRKVKDL